MIRFKLLDAPENTVPKTEDTINGCNEAMPDAPVEPAKQLHLVLEYYHDGVFDEKKSFQYNLLNEVDMLRYYVKQAPLCLAIWSCIPLPAGLWMKQMRAKYEEEMESRKQNNESEPQWTLAVFFPDEERPKAQRVCNLQRGCYQV